MAEHSTAPATAAAARRRGLGRGLTIFLVVDVLLVLAFLVVLALTSGGLGGAGTAEPDEPDVVATEPEPETTPEQSAPAEPEESEALEAFVLPSGNIFCSMTEDTASCTILSRTYEDPAPPAGCTGAVGSVLTVTAEDGASVPCVDTRPTEPPADAPVLEYGGGSTIGEMTCLSSQNGVFCRHNPTGAGFSLARAGYQIF